MEKTQDLKIKIDHQSSLPTLNESSNSITSPLSQPSSIPSPDQIRNLLLVMNDREQKLSELAAQQQKFILWRVQFIRLEREWNEVNHRIQNFL
jgi:hypothetical protein